MRSKCFLIVSITGLLILAAGCSTTRKVQFVKDENKVDVMVGEKHFTSYLYALDPDKPPADKKLKLTKPILFPVYSSSGIMVCRGYPMTQIKGETTDHLHHTGIYFTYDIMQDHFWANSKEQLPAVRHVRITEMKSKGNNGTLAVVLHWIGKEGRVLLEETRKMVFSAGRDENAIDFEIDLKAVGQKIEFGDTKEGMFAIRVADWLREEKGTGEYLSANGQRKEAGVWGKRSRWVRMQGQRDGKAIGIAIFHHPSSVNYPTYWMSRGYGLFSANPLGQYIYQKHHNIEGAKPFNLTLQPEQKAHFGFRMLIYEEPRTAEQLERRFKQFAR